MYGLGIVILSKYYSWYTIRGGRGVKVMLYLTIVSLVTPSVFTAELMSSIKNWKIKKTKTGK